LFGAAGQAWLEAQSRVRIHPAFRQAEVSLHKLAFSWAQDANGP
jgi:hypothetical protein